jgi:hypothetical protein
MYTIIQNILPESILIEIKSEIELLEYKLCEQSIDTDISKLSSYSNIQEYPVHMFSFYHCSNPEISNNIGVTIYNALKHFMQDEFTGYNLLRFHAAKSVKQNYYPRHKHTIPHCDWLENKCKTILFYLDDSDGTTVFFNEPFSENFYDDIGTRQFTISHENIPKRNSAIIFNSTLLHAMRPPLAYDSRTIFNIVLQKL